MRTYRLESWILEKAIKSLPAEVLTPADSITVVTSTKRRVQIIAFEHERIVRRPAPQLCPECRQSKDRRLNPFALSARSRARRVFHWLAAFLR